MRVCAGPDRDQARCRVHFLFEGRIVQGVGKHGFPTKKRGRGEREIA